MFRLIWLLIMAWPMISRWWRGRQPNASPRRLQAVDTEGTGEQWQPVSQKEPNR